MERCWFHHEDEVRSLESLVSLAIYKECDGTCEWFLLPVAGSLTQLKGLHPGYERNWSVETAFLTADFLPYSRFYFLSCLPYDAIMHMHTVTSV